MSVEWEATMGEEIAASEELLWEESLEAVSDQASLQRQSAVKIETKVMRNLVVLQ